MNKKINLKTNKIKLRMKYQSINHELNLCTENDVTEKQNKKANTHLQ